MGTKPRHEWGETLQGDEALEREAAKFATWFFKIYLTSSKLRTREEEDDLGQVFYLRYSPRQKWGKNVVD